MVKKQQQLQIQIMYSRSQQMDSTYVIPREKGVEGLTYSMIVEYRNMFMEKYRILTEVKMTYLNEEEDILPINEEFYISYEELFKIFDGSFVILLLPEIDEIETRINEIEQRMKGLEKEIKKVKKIRTVQEETYNNLYMKKHTSLPEGIKKQLSDKPSERTIDIGVLFSQPLVQKRDGTEEFKVAGEPVRYQEEVNRLKKSLDKTGMIRIYLKCCIASVSSLTTLMKQKVKILHVICHGGVEVENKLGIQEGVLQFQQLQNIGRMDKIYGRQIPEFLVNVPIDSKPKLVFLNACHSELIGDAFLMSGIPFVIVIQSSQKIEDTAAQLFAERFYNSLFNGVGVKDSFEDAKASINRQNRFLNSNICCCIHTTSHDPKCLFKKLCQESTKEFIHDLYHVPSCRCLKRHLNIHLTNCVWANDTLFAINQDFRVQVAKDEFRKPTPEQLSAYDELYICCCSNATRKIPHDQTQKFKFKHDKNVDPNQVLYKCIDFSDFIEAQVVDETSPELKGNFSRGGKLFGRNLNIFNLINDIKQNQRVVIVYGAQGSGKSKVVTRAVSYMYQRGYFQDQHIYIDMGSITNSIDFHFQIIKTFKDLKLNSVQQIYAAKSKFKIAIIMDNMDNFVKLSYPQFKNQIEKMLKRMGSPKIILVLNEKIVETLSTSIFNEKRYYLEPLKKFAAADMFILHAKEYLMDINMREVWKLFENENYRIPKTILDMVHFIKSQFSVVTKVSLKVAIEEMEKRDSKSIENGKFLEENIAKLQKDQETFKVFLFLCEFKDGLTELDFNIMSNPQGEEIPEESALIPENWREIVFKLLYYDKKEKPADLEEGGYYFCDVEQVGGFKKVRVKKYILEYMKKQTKYQDQNMRFNALAYMSIFSMTILKIIREQYQYHEKIIQYCNISNAGIFQLEREYRFAEYFDPGEYFPDAPQNLSKSTRKNNDIDKGIKKLFQKRTSLFKVKSTSIFLHQTNIKQLYKSDYVSYYALLPEQKQKLFRYYFLSLMINVPSNIMVANDDGNKEFLKHCIEKSISIVTNLSKKESKTIEICKMKLYMMKVANDLEAMEFPDIAMFNAHFQGIEKCRRMWDESSEIHKIVKMDCHLLRMGILYKHLKVNGRPETYTEIIQKGQSFKEVFETSNHLLMGNLILGAKVQLLLSQCFFFTRLKSKQNHRGFDKFKINSQYAKKQELLKEAVGIFRANHLKLLEVRTMVKVARFQFSIVKQRGSEATLDDFFNIKSYISEVRDISSNNYYNIVLKQSETELNDLEYKVTNIIQLKTNNFIVFMKSSPLSSVSETRVMNAVKRTHNFKRMIESIFEESILDQEPKKKQVSVLFEILTLSACRHILKQGCSIVVLTIDSTLKDDKVYLSFEKEDIPIEDKIQLSEFIKKVSFQNVKLIIICGQNSSRVGEEIQKENKGSVVVTVSFNSQSYSQKMEQFYDLGYHAYCNKTLQKVAFSTFIKNMMDKIVYAKAPIKNFDNFVEIHKLFTIYYMVKFSKQTSDEEKLKETFDVQVHREPKDKNTGIQFQFKAGGYHNISTQRSTLHNLKHLDQIFVGREKVLVEVMEEIIVAKNQNRPCYLNLYGNKSTGKSSLVQELASILVERGFYKKGIYYLSGSTIQKQCNGQLNEYLQKNKKAIFDMSYLNQQPLTSSSQVLLIIDDFHMIKEKFQYQQYFFNSIIDKCVNLIVTTGEKPMLSQQPFFKEKKTVSIELKKFSDQQFSLLSYTFIPLYDFMAFKKIYKEAYFNFMKKEKGSVIPQTLIEEFRELLLEANSQPEVNRYENYKVYMEQLRRFERVAESQGQDMQLLQIPQSKLPRKPQSYYNEMMRLSKKISHGK